MAFTDKILCGGLQEGIAGTQSPNRGLALDLFMALIQVFFSD